MAARCSSTSFSRLSGAARRLAAHGCVAFVALVPAAGPALGAPDPAKGGDPAELRIAPPADERLEYRWRLLGFFGGVAGLFFPDRGEGRLTRATLPNGNSESELWITSSADAEPDFFRYGAETHGETGATVRAWSSQLWRGKRKEKSSPVAESGVVDVASAIQRLRRDRLAAPERMEIWSDGKIYPVDVRPLGEESLNVAGKTVRARRIAIRPRTEPGRRVWKGELDLWLADDPAATPVRILVARSPARVQLELVRYP
jgi:hypothetical protein